MEITPEIIATKIWKWELDEERGHEGRIISSFWVEPDGCVHKILPTFQESEWTGPLLEKATSIADEVRIEMKSNHKLVELLKNANYKETGFHNELIGEGENKYLNYAIAKAILEAEGE